MSFPRPKFEAVNLNFLSFFHSRQSDCPRVFLSISFTLSASTFSLSNKVFSSPEISAGISNCLSDVLRGNLGNAVIGKLWLFESSLVTDVVSQ